MSMKMSKRLFREVKAKSEEYLRNWVARGRKLATYHCPQCDKDVETPRPRKNDVGEKGFWDGLKTCTECGGINFVRVYPSGKTEVAVVDFDTEIAAPDDERLSRNEQGESSPRRRTAIGANKPRGKKALAK